MNCHLGARQGFTHLHPLPCSLGELRETPEETAVLLPWLKNQKAMHVLQKKLCWQQKKYWTFSASISLARHQTFTEGAERRLTHCSLAQAPSSLKKILAVGNLEKRYNLQRSMTDTDTTSKGCLPLKKNAITFYTLPSFVFVGWLVGGWLFLKAGK